MARILVNQTNTPPNVHTGITSYTWSILDGLMRSGEHSYVLATTWGHEHIPDQILRSGIEVLHCAYIRNMTASAALNTLRLPFLAKQHQCDVIFNPQPFGAMYSTLPQVVVVHDVYSLSHGSIYSRSYTWQTKILLPVSLRSAEAIVCVSHFTADIVRSYYPYTVNKMLVVHEAASPLIAPSNAHAATGSQLATDRYGLVVASVTPNKNLEQLFQALQYLVSRNIHFKVYHIGADPYDQLSTLGRKYPNVDITPLGRVSDDVLSRYYSRAFCYINTSFVEGFCLPVLEAQQRGIPVLCSDIPVLREVAGDGALFIPVGNAQMLAEAILMLLSSEDQVRDLSLSGLQNAEKFSWHTAAITMDRLFSRLAAKT